MPSSLFRGESDTWNDGEINECLNVAPITQQMVVLQRLFHVFFGMVEVLYNELAKPVYGSLDQLIG